MTKTLTFKLSVTAMAVIALFIAGCGGGGGSDPAPAQSDTTRPYVLTDQVSPAPGSTIPRTPLIMTLRFSEALACPQGVQPITAKSDTGSALPGNYTCTGDLVTATVPATSLETSNLKSVTFELKGFSDRAGNVMEAPYVWTYPVAPPPAAVALSATPNPVTAGNSVTITWTATNAVSCVGSGGLSGVLAHNGGSVTVSPTATTEYGIQCWNSANVATDVATTTVTVTPAPVSHAHGGTVLLLRNFILHRVTPTGLLPNVNHTGIEFRGAYVNLTPTADCRLRVSARQDYTNVEYKLLYSPATGAMDLDTSAEGAALRRDTDYVYSMLPDWNDHPEWAYKVHRPEGSYHVPYDATWELKIRRADGMVIDLTPGAAVLVTGIVQVLVWVPPCPAPPAN